MLTAGAYSSVNHYLKAVQAAGTDDAKAVMAKMREIPVNDVMTKNGKLREDGRLVRDMYLFQVKSPSGVQEQGRHLQAAGHRAGRRGGLSAAERGSKCPLVKRETSSFKWKGAFGRHFSSCSRS